MRSHWRPTNGPGKRTSDGSRTCAQSRIKNEVAQPLARLGMPGIDTHSRGEPNRFPRNQILGGLGPTMADPPTVLLRGDRLPRLEIGVRRLVLGGPGMAVTSARGEGAETRRRGESVRRARDNWGARG